MPTILLETFRPLSTPAWEFLLHKKYFEALHSQSDYIALLTVRYRVVKIKLSVQKIFDHLVDSYLEHNTGLTDYFLDKDLSNHLTDNLLLLYSSQELVPASIGQKKSLRTDGLLRSDKIFWLDRSHQDIHENTFFDVVDEFVAFLNRSCFTGITRYEFHYALYEKGNFYRRHLDQFKEDKGRAFSMIIYLNDEWKEEDGGGLVIYHDTHEQHILPDKQKCVFFKSSELEHEVLITHRPRMSITGWLRTD
jgi:SM-20-related protein